MSKYPRFVILSGMLLFVLLLSLAHPTSAYADDGAPPPPATEEPVGPATGGAVQPPTEAPTDEVPPPTEVPSVEPPVAEDTTVAEILEAAPEGTEVVLLNGEGDLEPLVTQDAVEIIQGGDPYFTALDPADNLVKIFYFMPNGGCGSLDNCVESDTPIQTAIDYLSGIDAASPWVGTGTTPTDGTIYVEAETYTEDVTIDGLSWNDGAPAALTLSGAGSGMTILNGSIFIMNMNTFTLSGFTVEAGNSESPAGIFAVGNTGTLTLSDVNVTNSAGDGIDIIMHNGDVEMTHVTASGNAGSGLGSLIEETEGANGASLLYILGKVNIKDSNFNQNTGTGLFILSFDDISLSNVIASDNAAYGSILMNMNIFEENPSIVSESDGNITSVNTLITNSQFDGNGEDGAVLMTEGDATIICSQFKGNLGIGVDGYDVGGLFTLDDVTFSENGMDYDGTPVILSGGCQIVNKNKDNKPTSLPLHTVPVNGGEEVGLNCSEYSGTELVLPNGDKVILHCPVLGTAVLIGQTLDQLPGQVGGYIFLSGLNVLVSKDGGKLKTVSPALTVDFIIPEDEEGANLAILHWDGSQWIELPDCYVTANGYFQARTNYTGFFVLVSK